MNEELLLTEEETKATSPTAPWYVGCKQCAQRIAKAQLAKATPIIERREREKIFADIKQHTISIRPDKTAPGWLKITLNYLSEYWQTLKGASND